MGKKGVVGENVGNVRDVEMQLKELLRDVIGERGVWNYDALVEKFNERKQGDKGVVVFDISEVLEAYGGKNPQKFEKRKGELKRVLKTVALKAGARASKVSQSKDKLYLAYIY